MINTENIKSLIDKLKGTRTFLEEQRQFLEEMGKKHNIVDEVFSNLLQKMQQLEEKIVIQYENLEVMLSISNWNPAEEIMRLKNEIADTLAKFIPVEEPDEERS